MEQKTPFAVLNAINCNEHTEKMNGLTYLSWAWAWQICKQNFADANYTIYENEHGWNYFTDGRTAWVKTGVTIQGTEHIEYLPVLDFKNRSIPLEEVTSFDVNKAIQRSLTKALARHGLGLYIYAKEDLPDAGDDKERTERRKKPTTPQVEERHRVMTPAEFLDRWDSGDDGGGITNDECAECARAWGVCSNPRIKPIDTIVDMVVKYARANVAPVKKKLTDSQLYSIIRAYVDGEKTKSGGDYRETWIKDYHPTNDEIQDFDKKAAEYLSAKDGKIDL